MSKKNSKARKALKRIYGDGCFVERAGIRKITGYKKDAHMITYHHLRHQSEGGKATVENGANVALENHEWLHTLPREEEEKVNDAIREWKANFLIMKGSGEIENRYEEKVIKPLNEMQILPKSISIQDNKSCKNTTSSYESVEIFKNKIQDLLQNKRIKSEM